MLNRIFKPMIAIALAAMTVGSVNAQNLKSAEDDYTYDRDQRVRDFRIDRYLDVEVWTNNSDGEYYVGDNVTIKFRASRDAFVAIYSIDSRNRVSLLFPANPGDDNFIRGGVTYSIPDGYSDYDLIVSGPEGVENIQIISSRERFPVPDWYRLSGLVFDWEDRFEYMDYLNHRYFVRYDGQKFAYDRTVIYVNEWEPYYFRPVYYPSYPSWTVYGNFYVDYPYGSSVYINGIYWGCTPLYIPRIYVGWHTISIYDHYGHGWESDFHITRYHTVVLDRNVIHTSPNVYSKYKKVRQVGYRAPASNGYPDYASKVTKIKAAQGKITINGKTVNNQGKYRASTTKKYSRGEARLVKTKRGWETSGPVVFTGKKGSRKSSSYGRSTWSERNGKTSGSKSGYSGGTKSSGGKAGYRSDKSSPFKSSTSTYKQRKTIKSGSSKKSSGYYQRKSGSSKQKASTGSKQYKSGSTKKSGSGTVKRTSGSGSGKSSGRSSSVKSSGKSKSGSGSRTSGGGRSKTSGSKGKPKGGK